MTLSGKIFLNNSGELTRFVMMSSLYVTSEGLSHSFFLKIKEKGAIFLFLTQIFPLLLALDEIAVNNDIEDGKIIHSDKYSNAPS